MIDVGILRGGHTDALRCEGEGRNNRSGRAVCEAPAARPHRMRF